MVGQLDAPIVGRRGGGGGAGVHGLEDAGGGDSYHGEWSSAGDWSGVFGGAAQSGATRLGGLPLVALVHLCKPRDTVPCTPSSMLSEMEVCASKSSAARQDAKILP